ncbi:hypothetical protein ABW19_dt0208184 [Dactylella cylindrospora]|nr:hypothetical protein ABW19_dt0208184 [Dactylella cylindrospora]
MRPTLIYPQEQEYPKVRWVSSGRPRYYPSSSGRGRLQVKLSLLYGTFGFWVNIWIAASSLSESNSSGPSAIPLEDRLLDRFDEARARGIWSKFQALNDILETILDAVNLDEAVAKFAPEATRPAPKFLKTMHEILYPPVLNLELKTINGTPRLEHKRELGIFEVDSGPEFSSAIRIDPKLPIYSTMDLVVPEPENFEGIPGAYSVLLGGKRHRCKVQPGGYYRDGSRKQEAEILLDIQTIFQNDPIPIHIPKIIAYVKHPEFGNIIGFIQEWIPTLQRRSNFSGISHISHRYPEVKGNYWASQVRDIVRRLHDVDILWGGGDPWKVVMDRDGNAWVVDFEPTNDLNWNKTYSKDGDLETIDRLEEL